jgi:O-antigen/teichoic acid export membrane protein
MSLVRNTSITVVAHFLSSGAAALSALVVATTLGAAGAGTFAQVRVIPTVIAALLGAGITIANPYLVGSRKYSVQRIAETTIALGLLMGAFGFGLWVLAGDLLHARFFGELPRAAVLVVGLSIPLHLLRNYLNSIQQGLLTFKAANLVLVAEEVTALLLVLPLIWSTGDGSRLIVVAAIGGVAASCLVATGFLVRHGVRPWPRLDRAIARESILFGMKGHIGRMANMLTWRLDIMILSTLASIEVVGYYAVASKAAELFRPLSASLTFVLRPLIASLSLAEARARGVFLYRRVFAINLLAVAVMAVAGRPLIIGLFGAEFEAAVPAFQILLIGLAAHGADGVLSGYNVGIGRPELNTYTALAGMLVTVIADIMLIPPYGLVGAAIASSIAYTVKAATFTGIFLFTSGVTLPQLVGLKGYSPDPA